MCTLDFVEFYVLMDNDRGNRNTRSLHTINLSDFEYFCDTQSRRSPENQPNMSDDEQERRGSSAQFSAGVNTNQDQVQYNSTTAPNIDVNALIMSMNNLMQQNATIMQMLAKNTTLTAPAPVQSYTVMPDFSKIIPNFNGTDLLQSKSWIEGIESAAMLHNWPPEFKLQTAKMHLIDAAASWYEARRHDLTVWDNFKSAFVNTFVHEKNLTSLWKAMTSRTQGPREDLSLYFHNKVRLCKELGLTFDEQKEQIAIGLFSRELSAMIISKTHVNMDALYRDLLSYDRITNERRRRYTTEDRKPNIRATTAVNQTTQATHYQVPKYKQSTANQGAIAKSVRCFNCQEEGHFVTNCTKPKRERGSCFICGSLEHQQRSCPQKFSNGRTNNVKKTENDASTNLVEVYTDVVPSYRVKAQVCIEEKQKKITPILDTGSAISLIISSCVPEYLIDRNKQQNSFYGINNSNLQSLGMFKTKIILDGLCLDVSFYVVPETTMQYDCLLGRDFIVGNNLSVTFCDKAIISQNNYIENNTERENNIFLIDLPFAPDFDLDINPNLAPKQILHFFEIFENNYVNASRSDEPETKFEMTIKIKPNHLPFFFRPRRLSFYEKNEVNRIVKELLEKGIIRKSNSEYSSPIVLVPKKPTGLRMCVDYRKLNDICVRDNWPLPLIDDQIDLLRNKKFFTQLDLKDAFHHVSVNKDSIKYTSFVTHNSQYEYIKMPFGLKNSPANFSRYINLIFRELIEQNKMCIYADDICIATQTFEENLEILIEIFDLLVSNHLELNLKKCSFFKNAIQFLGYRITENCITPASHNVEAIKSYPVPKNFKDVQSFLGLTSYFRRFIKKFSLLAKPLYDLLKRETNFKFGEEELNSFETLKTLLIQEPILSIYDPKAETQLHCDASSHGFGSILMQKQSDLRFHPVFYFSKRTTNAESKLHSYELEMLSIVNSLKRFRIYLQGIEFKIITDCNSIKLALQKKDINPRILRWSLELQNYSYTIEHRPNSQMIHADSLSRNSILILEDNSFERNLSIMQDRDKDICKIREGLEKAESKLFELRNGLVYRKNDKNKVQFYVPSSMEQSVIRTYHDEVGHVGENKTCELISRTYWFPSMKQKIKQYILNCLKCISYSPIYGKCEGFLNSIPKGNLPFQTIHIDHYGPLEKTRFQHKYILLVIDSFTKYVKIYPCTTTQTKPVIKHLLSYFNHYSRPLRIISDRGTSFTSNEFKDFVTENSIQHVLIATGVPRANGQAEVINRSINSICSKLSHDLNKWDEILNKVEFAINNTVNRSTGYTPSMLLFGINQRGQVYDNLREFLEGQDNPDRNLVLVREEASTNIIKSQEYNKYLYDKKHKVSHGYKVGDYVMVVNTDVSAGINKKLIPKYRGPYVIKTILANDRYVVGDIEGFQVTQMPFEGVMAPSRMKPWMEDESE